MHPLEKILILMAIGQLGLVGYVIHHTHALHRTSFVRWVIKMTLPVVIAFSLIFLVLRIFNLIPYMGV